MRNTNIKLIFTAAAAALVTGCAGAWNGPDQAMTIAEAHPISVDSQVVALTLDIAASRNGLSALDKARLRGFADAYLTSGHGLIAVSAPTGSSSDRTGEALAASARDYLAQVGVDHSAMSDVLYTAGDDRGRQVVLSYTQYVATPSACGNWAGMKARDYGNQRSPNFGCATQNNLAAMVADPRDLVVPADQTAPDAMSRIRGIKAYREGDKTESKAGDIDAKVAQ